MRRAASREVHIGEVLLHAAVFGKGWEGWTGWTGMARGI